jgi:cytochrome c oxidase cbb3-type subunit II
MAHRTWAIFVGIVFTLAASFAGLVVIPRLQLISIESPRSPDRIYPVEPFGDISRGRREYISLGCLYCHSQQVRPVGFGSDIERGWGTRQSAPGDYRYQQPPLLGTMRTGPDLANIAARQPSREWHLLHLYDPQLTSPGSVMPAFPFLFERVEKATGRREPRNALGLPPGRQAELTHWVVVTERAQWLVTYLLSLNQKGSLEELGGG